MVKKEFKKSEEVKVNLKLRNGKIRTFNILCYEFRKGTCLDRYVVLKNGGLSNDAHVRFASMCLAHIFNFTRCDCYDQLHLSLEKIMSKDNSLLIYGIDQDGRAHGHFKHIQAIGRMDKYGEHTYDALPDKREYEHVGQILRDLGLSRINLYTNNPDKIKALKKQGLEVKQLSLEVPATKENMLQMKQKRERGHRLKINGKEHVGE
jgi:GTP cyclohydrolase II